MAVEVVESRLSAIGSCWSSRCSLHCVDGELGCALHHHSGPIISLRAVEGSVYSRLESSCVKKAEKEPALCHPARSNGFSRGCW